MGKVTEMSLSELAKLHPGATWKLLSPDESKKLKRALLHKMAGRQQTTASPGHVAKDSTT
jgi:hypothetical protein